MSRWTALGRGPEGWRGFALDGSEIVGEVEGPHDADVLSRLGLDGPVLRLGDGTPDKVPAPVLPQGGARFPGLMQDRPADVLGGWPRLWLAGLLAARPGWDGVAVVTEGDVRHWLHLSAGEVVSMQGVLTPRLQAALGGATAADPEAVADTMSRPERLAAHLRTAQVAGVTEAVTGHLLGAELAAAKAYWLGQSVVVAGGAEALAGALQVQGVPVEVDATDALERRGLAVLGQALGFA